MQESRQGFSTNFTYFSEANTNYIEEKIEDLTLKNIKLQSILAKEKFQKESKIKLQQTKIE